MATAIENFSSASVSSSDFPSSSYCSFLRSSFLRRYPSAVITHKVVDLLEKERVERKITKTEINEKTGLSRTARTLTVSKKNSPTLRTLLMVADVIGVDLKQIIAEAEK